MTDDESPTPQELLAEQEAKAASEAARSDDADLEAEEHEADRRADKAAYLRDKLLEQRAADVGDR